MPQTPILFTALDVITAALDDLNVSAAGEPVRAENAALGFQHLNRLVMQLRTQEFTIPFINRQLFAMVADQSTYTLGPDGDLVVQRPQQLEGVGLLLNPAAGPVDAVGSAEIPLSSLTDNAYQALRVKALSSRQPIQYYYNPTYADGLGTLWLWPTPNVADNALVLYLDTYVDTFADLVTPYAFPPGYFDLLEYGLGRRLQIPFSNFDSGLTGALQQQFGAAQALVKRSNIKMNDMPTDVARIGGTGGVYDILSDTVR